MGVIGNPVVADEGVAGTAGVDASLAPGCLADHTARSAHSRSRTLSGLALACLILTGLQLLFYTGPMASDDFIYLRMARDYAGERPTGGGSLTYARLAAWVPLRVCTWLTGPGAAALLPMPLLAAIGSTIGVWLFVRRHLGASASWVAVFALGLSPLFLLYATIWQPDSAAGLWVMLALLAAGPVFLNPACKRPVARALVGGFVIGIGYSAKETAVLAGPGIALFVLLFRTRCGWAWRRLGMVAAGALVFLGVEVVALWVLTGNPLFRLQAITQSQHDFGTPPAAGVLTHYLSEYLRWMLNPSGPFGWWGLVYLAAGAAALWKSPDVVRLVLCVVAVTFGYLTVGTTDLAAYFPIHHQPRYLLVPMPLATVLVVHAFGRVWHAGTTGRWAAAAVAIALVVNTIHYANLRAGKSYAADTFAAGRKLFDPDPPGAGPWPPNARLCASGETMVRLWPLVKQAGHQPIEQIAEPPTTAAVWLQHYEGAYVLVSRRDRVPDRDVLGVLTRQSRAALSAFPVVASAAPGTTRFGEIGAWLGLCEPQPDWQSRIDAYHVAPPPQGTASRGTQTNPAQRPGRAPPPG